MLQERTSAQLIAEHGHQRINASEDGSDHPDEFQPYDERIQPGGGVWALFSVFLCHSV